MNISCSTCLESITLKCDVSATSCGHLFHTKCIKDWVYTDKWKNKTRHKVIQRSCPQCRSTCNYLTKLYFTEDVENLSKVDTKPKEVMDLESEKEKLEQKVDELENTIIDITKTESKIVAVEKKSNELKKENEKLKKQVNDLESEREKLEQKVDELETIIIDTARAYESKVVALEKKSNELKKENAKLRKSKTKLEKRVEEFEAKNKEYEEAIKQNDHLTELFQIQENWRDIMLGSYDNLIIYVKTAVDTLECILFKKCDGKEDELTKMEKKQIEIIHNLKKKFNETADNMEIKLKAFKDGGYDEKKL